MSSHWYVCPYETVSAPGGNIGRRAAIARYIPATPGPSGENWDEAEVLGNHVVVKVVAPDALHAAIQADSDFRLIPLGQVEIPPNERGAIRDYLEGLGYTRTEVTSTGYTVTQILDLLTTAASNVVPNAGNTGFDILPGRRLPPKTVSQIEARLPD